MSHAALGGILFMGSNLPAPVLTSLTSPLLASALGGGQSITLSGSNLSSVTGVKVGSASATGISSTSLSVTFTAPANTASSTPYNISVMTANGTATLSNALYSLPASSAILTAVWYAAQGWNNTAITWTDIINGYVLSVQSGNPPTYTTSWTNSQPAISTSSTVGVFGNFVNPKYNFDNGSGLAELEVLTMCNLPSIPSNYSVLLSSDSVAYWIVDIVASFTTIPRFYTPSGNISGNSLGTTPHWIEYFSSGTASSSFCNN